LVSLRWPERPATASGIITGFAPGLAGVSTRLSFPIVICWCQGRVRGIQLAPAALALDSWRANGAVRLDDIARLGPQETFRSSDLL
jgi:hypothetical protein